jgi:uncharacterized protein YkwD
MKTFRLPSLLLGLLLAACGPNSTPNQRFTPYPEESQFLALTNAFRATAQTCGTQQFPAAPALTWVEAVGDAAWFHSIDMSNADTENHVGASTAERLRGRGFTAGLVAEHRKKTALPGNANDPFNIWKADPATCANLMSPNFTVMGAGYAGHHDGKTSAYWTQILAAPTGAPSITLNPTTATVKVGGAAILFNVILTNSTATINWTLNGAGTLSSPTGASTNYTPPATGAAGKATLTATAGGLSVLAAITIDAAAPTATLTITPSTATTTVGTTTATSFQAILTGSTDPMVWSLEGPGVIGTNGAFAAYIPPSTGNGGTATLTAKAGALTATATITINPAGPPPTLSVAPTTATVTVGGAAIPFTATLANSNAAIAWTLTGPGSLSATTGATTNYTPPTTGGASTATLTATAGALTASATITINAAAPTLTITPPTANVLVGSAPIQFKASSNQITWEMTGVGTFSWAGDTFTYNPPATGNGGTATITAKAVTGNLTATATVTVSPAPVLTLTPINATVNVGGAAIAFNATLTNSNATITWTMTGPGSIAPTTGPSTSYTPPATGGAGTATVTATVGLLTATANITINFNPNALQVEVKDLQRQVFVPEVANGPFGLHISDRPVAPMAANPGGGAHILWVRSTDKKAFLTQVDGAGNAVGADQDLGSAEVAGAVGSDGNKVAYMLKTGPDQLLFKVVGGGQTLLVNNKQPAPWPGGNVFGNTAMLRPVDFRRQAVVPVNGGWFASFDHNNDFSTTATPDVHTGMSMVMLDGNGTAPKLGVPWGVSHALDILALNDGTNTINVTVGDGFPQDFRLHVLDQQGQPLLIGTENKVDLFAKNKFNVDGQVVDNVPGNSGGLSSGKLGGLSNIGGGQFALTYLIKPSGNPVPPALNAKINEVGMLIFDKQGTAQRVKIKDGTDVSYVRSARYGNNILVAWETTAGKFFATVVSTQGTVVRAEQELVTGIVFSERDSFINLSNGDVMWSASVGGSLKVFRLPAP